MGPSVGVRILLCLLTSLVSFVHLADPQASFAKFVIIGQHSQFDNLKTAALKDSLSQQIESSGESVEVIVPHVDFPDIAGFWTTWTLFSRISSLAPSECPTIIHHFFGYEEREMLLFPEFATGFVLSDALLTSLAIAMNTTAAKATDAFTIDPKHELARLILKQGKTILRSHPDRFCSRKMPGCAISFEETKCAVEPGIKPQDIYVGVKTFSEYHTTRIPVIKRTWSASLPSIEYYSDLVNNVIPTIDSGIPNTERGHCGKTFVILKRFVKLLDDGAKFSWLLISDDDTLISIPRLLRLLSCHDNSEKIIIGERYGYGFSSFGATGYDYPTGGAGMVFSPSAARTIVSKCACPSDDAPDDMIIGMCSMRFEVAIIHNAAFHQARPIDYPEEYIQRIAPISFHKFDEIDPYEVYMEYLFEPPVAQRKTEL
nr:Fringe domain containing protein [Haemonchus contortus]